jgi:hypothetical protein
VTGLSSSTANPLDITVTGTSSGQTATVALTVFLADYSLSATPSGTTVVAGKNATYTITVTPTNGFNQAVLLSCGTIPYGTTCFWAPPALAMTGTATASSTLTLDTTTQASGLFGLPQPRNRPPGWGRWILLLALLTLLGAAFTVFRRSGPRMHPHLRLAVLLVAIILIVLGVGCENYVNPININPTVNGTPSGNFSIVLTGTLGTGGGVTRTTTVNLSVLPTD